MSPLQRGVNQLPSESSSCCSIPQSVTLGVHSPPAFFCAVVHILLLNFPTTPAFPSLLVQLWSTTPQNLPRQHPRVAKPVPSLISERLPLPHPPPLARQSESTSASKGSQDLGAWSRGWTQNLFLLFHRS